MKPYGYGCSQAHEFLEETYGRAGHAKSRAKAARLARKRARQWERREIREMTQL